MGRRHCRISRDVVIGVTEEIRDIEDEPCIDDAKDDHEEAVFDCRVRRERDRVLVRFWLNAGRIVLSRDVQRPNVQHHHTRDREGQQVVQ